MSDRITLFFPYRLLRGKHKASRELSELSAVSSRPKCRVTRPVLTSETWLGPLPAGRALLQQQKRGRIYWLSWRWWKFRLFIEREREDDPKIMSLYKNQPVTRILGYSGSVQVDDWVCDTAKHCWEDGLMTGRADICPLPACFAASLSSCMHRIVRRLCTERRVSSCRVQNFKTVRLSSWTWTEPLIINTFEKTWLIGYYTRLDRLDARELTPTTTD